MATFELSPALAPFSAPLKTFEESYGPAARMVVGAFIFSHAQTGSSSVQAAQGEDVVSAVKPRMLLLQRASNDAFGDLWDFPGGSVEEELDRTLLDAVAREVWEETGLHMADVVELVGVNTWQDTRKGQERPWTKFSFTITVAESNADEPLQVKLAEDEHQAFRWVEENEIQASLDGTQGAFKFISRDQIEIASKAFKRLERRRLIDAGCGVQDESEAVVGSDSGI